jgi:hypothetical protein
MNDFDPWTSPHSYSQPFNPTSPLDYVVAEESRRPSIWRGTFWLALIIIAALTIFGASMAFADTTKSPSRIADIYGGLNHQPTRLEIEDRQRAAGVGQNLRQRAADDEMVQKLYEELMRRARAG